MAQPLSAPHAHPSMHRNGTFVWKARGGIGICGVFWELPGQKCRTGKMHTPRTSLWLLIEANCTFKSKTCIRSVKVGVYSKRQTGRRARRSSGWTELGGHHSQCDGQPGRLSHCQSSGTTGVCLKEVMLSHDPTSS